MATQYAERGTENRVRVGWNVPDRIKRDIEGFATDSGRSESAVVSEILDEAINGKKRLARSA